MKKHLRRLLSVVLAFALAVSLAAGVSAVKIVASGSCGKNVSWQLDGNGVFTVSGRGPMDGYTTYDENGYYNYYGPEDMSPAPIVPWHDYLDQIRTAVVEPGVTSVSHGTFTFCGNLESVSLPDGLKTIAIYSFGYCTSLREITIPDSVEDIQYGAFWGCEKLQRIRIPAAAYVQGGAMSGCTGLQRIDVADGNPFCRSVDGVLFSMDGEELLQYPSGRKGAYVIPEGVKRYTAAFCDCPGLTKLTLASSLEEFGSLECLPGLKECVLAEGMTRIPGRFFADCTALERVTIPSTLKIVGGQAFSNCSSLQSINLPEGLTTIEEWAFADCTGLKHLNLPSTLTEIGGLAFCRCRSWCDKVVVPSGVRVLSQWAFLGCDSLTSITLPDTLEEIGELCFSHNPGLTTLAIPDSVKTIGESAFKDCVNLQCLVLPSGLKEIPEWMFGNDKKLRTVGIPRSVKQIDFYAFGGCWWLRDVYYEGSEAEWNKIQVDNTDNWNRALLEATIHFNSDLSRMPKPVMKTPVGGFRDVFSDDYYADAVLWAVQHEPQITNGTEPGVFSPGAACTRAQMVTFLWRAAGCPQPKDKTNPFRDVKSGDYFYQAVLWAVENGITAGTGANTFSPGARVTRAQTVTFLWRTAKSPAVAGSVPFQDVPTRQYYTDAVLWAVKKKITNGTDATHFSPDASCTRGQIVTFLYRAVKE